MDTGRAMGWATLMALLTLPTPVGAQELLAIEDRADRLEAWFAVQRGAMREVRFVAGPASIAAGALVLGAGIAAAADNQYADHPNLAWLQIGVGIMSVAQGAVWLTIVSDPEARWARWRAAREQGLDAEALARFEGELRAFTQIAQMERALYRWSGLGLIFGGVVVLGALPNAGASDGHQIAGYTTAGVYTAVGAVLLVASLIPTLGEQGWARYREGLAPARAGVSWRLTPWAGRFGAGASVVGRY